MESPFERALKRGDSWRHVNPVTLALWKALSGKPSTEQQDAWRRFWDSPSIVIHALDDPSISDSLKSIISICDSAVKINVLHKFPLKERIYVHFSPRMQFEASVALREGLATIIIPAGTVLILLAVFTKCILNPRVLGFVKSGSPSYIYVQSTAGSTKLSDLTPTGSLKPLFQQLRIDGRETAELLNSAGKDRAGLVLACVTIAIQFLVLHELEHITQGHIAYLAQRRAQNAGPTRSIIDYSETDGRQPYSILHMFELMADIGAVDAIIRQVISGNSFLSMRQLDIISFCASRIGRLRAALLSVDLLFLTINAINSFAKGVPELSTGLNWLVEPTDDDHPPALLRGDYAKQVGITAAAERLGFWGWPWSHREITKLEKQMQGMRWIAWMEADLPSPLGDDGTLPEVTGEQLLELHTKMEQGSRAPVLELLLQNADMRPILDQALRWWLQQTLPNNL